MGVADDNGIGCREREVAQGLDDRLGVGFGVLHVFGGNDKRDDVAEAERLYECAGGVVAAACGYGEDEASVMEPAQGIGNMREEGDSNLAVDVFEYLAVARGTLGRLLLAHGCEKGKSL